jgi:DNA-binding NarL/FixJ family response regulator
MGGSSGIDHGPNLSCILVDDNRLVLGALASLLESQGITVAGVARGGLEALRLLQNSPAATLVLDVNMPDLGGLEVARRAGEIARRKHPIVFYSSYVDTSFVAEALDAGAQAVVLKDAPPTNLLDALAAVAAGRIYIDPRLRSGWSTSR